MPTRYQDFVESFNNMRKRLIESEAAYRKFAEQLISGLREYGQVPDNGFQWKPLDVQTPVNQGTMSNAVDFESDGWLHARFSLDAGHGWVTVLLRISRQGDQWTVAHGEDQYRITEGDNEARRNFYEGFFEGIIAQLDEIEEVGQNADRDIEIGFRPGES